jgi:hypothetical protein
MELALIRLSVLAFNRRNNFVSTDMDSVLVMALRRC